MLELCGGGDFVEEILILGHWNHLEHWIDLEILIVVDVDLDVESDLLEEGLSFAGILGEWNTFEDWIDLILRQGEVEEIEDWLELIEPEDRFGVLGCDVAEH